MDAKEAKKCCTCKGRGGYLRNNGLDDVELEACDWCGGSGIEPEASEVKAA